MSHVWTYWEGPIPPYIDVCLKSLNRVSVGCHFTVVTPQNVWNYVPRDSLDIELVFSKLKEPAHHADCIRAALLATHGGLYVDADTVGIRRLDTLANKLGVTHVVWPTPPRRIPNGYIAASPGSAFAARWLDEVNRRLHDLTEFTWSEFGEQIITPLIDNYFKREATQTTLKTFLPVDVDSDVERLFSTKRFEDEIAPETVTFGLNNSYMMAEHADLMTCEVTKMRRSKLMIHRLLVDAHDRNGK